MIDYCTDQFLQVRYPNGAGGKFLITCLFMFDAVAHWDSDVDANKKTHLEWCHQIWPTDINRWVVEEPNQPWTLDFYSRRFFRNNDITSEEFNQLANKQGSEYFHKSWQSGKLITDHWHKNSVPDFFKNANWIEILLDSQNLEHYKQCTRDKLFFWKDDTGTVFSAPDAPDMACNRRTLENIIKYQNPVVIEGYKSYDDFFYNYLLKQHFVEPFLDADPDPNCILSIQFDDLIMIDRFLSVIEKLENYFNQRINHDDALKSHELWKNRSHLS